MTLVVILTPIIALLSYSSSNRLSQASWHIVFCISHTKPDSVSTLFQAFDSFVCNNRCLLISPHASVIPHYRRHKKKRLFFSTAQIRQMLAHFWFSGPPFSDSALSRLLSTLPAPSGVRYRQGAATGESERAIWSNWQVPGRCLQLCWHFPASPLSIYAESSSYKPKA